nr:putative wax ester synthase/acyl-CoA:diacylglycerol acyltransferase [uncultured bacterium]
MLKQLAAQDAQFLYMQTPNNLTHVMGLNIYDQSTAPGGKVRLNDIIDFVKERQDRSPLFKRKLYRLPFDMDHPYWVEDEHFDVEAHFSHSRLPEPGDWRQLCIQVARYHSKPMDMNRPLWDMLVIEGLDRIKGFAKGSYAIANRIHHAAIDGASGAQFFLAMSDIDAKGTPAVPDPQTEWDIGDVPSPTEYTQRALSSTATSPVKMINALMKFAPALVDAAQKSFKDRSEEKVEGMPDTRFNGSVSPHKMFDAVTFALDDFKAIRKKVEGATINDVVLATVGGALRKYLIKHKELPKQSLIGWAPVNARTREGEDESPGNNISAMTVEIGSDVADPLKRLEVVRDLTRESKAAKSGLSARLMTDLSKHIPGATMAGVARIMTNERFAPKMSNVFISNVPGPQFPLYMNGAKCTHQFALAPLGNGMGLFVATPSYNGQMSFNVTSDRKMMPDIDFFIQCIEKSFNELRVAKTNRAVKKAPAKASTANMVAAPQSDGSNYRRVSKTPRRAKQGKTK